jgi:hypothetical protein
MLTIDNMESNRSNGYIINAMHLSRRDRIVPVAAPGALSSTFFPCTQLAVLSKVLVG